MLCLPKPLVDTFIKGIKAGQIDPATLASMTSDERNKLLSSFVGEGNAASVNALFESKLLMKNQETAMISWVKQVAGLKPKVQRDLIARINRLGKVLTPGEREMFFKDLAAQKLGTEVSVEQAEVISKLASEFNAAKADPNSGLKYGASEVALNNYVNDIRLANESMSIKETLGAIKKDPVDGIKTVVSELAGAAKGIKASMDNSAIFRQGWKVLFTNPQIWAKNAAQTFTDIAKQLKVKASDTRVLDGIKAEIYSRANARSGVYKQMKLDIGNLEEAFPSSLPEKIPLFNRLYQASQTAYTGFLYRTRADIADKLIKQATEQGVNLADKAQAESIGKLINSLTGRGSLGALEKIGKEINTVFFSPKMLKANIDFLTAHQFQRNVSPFVRKQAATNLLKVVMGTATIMGIAETLHPGSIETDPRSSDFGKIRIGDTRFSIGGGMESIVTLATRLLRQSSKSSTTGKVTELGTGAFGSKNGMDVIEDFLQNKLSPASAVMKDLFNQRDFDGNPITLGGELNNLLTPLPIQNAIDTSKEPDSAGLLWTMIADGLGISTNTYGSK